MEGVLLTYADILAKTREVDPEVAIASENFMDRAFPFVDVSYARMNQIDMPSPALKYTFPEWTATICAESPGDFNVMNNGMRYGLVWAVQPRHYNDSMDERLTRPLSRYVQELIRIRVQTQGRALLRDGFAIPWAQKSKLAPTCGTRFLKAWISPARRAWW